MKRIYFLLVLGICAVSCIDEKVSDDISDVEG
jgi:hypothetical protein